MFSKQPREMSCPDAQSICKIIDSPNIQSALLDQSQGPFNGCSGAIPCGAKWSCFRSAPQTGAIACMLCRSSSWVVADIFRERVFRGADRTTVDFCRADSGEELPIKAWVAPQPRRITRLKIQHEMDCSSPLNTLPDP